jgi:L-glutamine-phosphate cytidylyltransferase
LCCPAVTPLRIHLIKAGRVKAIILAAGLGTRLQDPWGLPKCVQPVGGVPLVQHQVAFLSSVGITDVLVVVGYRRDVVRAALGQRVTYVVNKSFRETNSLVSFVLAAQECHEDVIVLNGDVFFHPVLISYLLASPGDALLYDSTSGYEEEHMKVRVSGGHLVEMSKTLPVELICGENVGMLRLTRQTVEDLVRVARAVVATGGRQAWLAVAVNQVARDHRIECLDVAPWPWVEIDFQEDLVRARTEVLPAVVAALEDLPTLYPVSVTAGSAS